MAQTAKRKPATARRISKPADVVRLPTADQFREILARGRARKRVEPAEGSRTFDAYAPFPGVLPPDQEKPQLAQDSAIPEATVWANASLYSGAFFEGVTFLGYAFLSELLQRPEYRVISEVIASEMTREWIEIKSTGEEGDTEKADKIKAINDRFEELKVKAAFAKAALHDGGFGRGHVYLDTGDTDERDELRTSIGNGRDAASREKVTKRKPLKALRNVEPVWTYPTQYDSNDPLKADWYNPSHWFVMGKEVHRSRLLTFIGREVPDLLKPAYAFGGLSASQMAKPYVDNWLRIRQSVSDLVQAFSVMVLSTDLQALIQNGGDQLFTRIELFNLLRQNNGVMALNKDTEEFANVAAPLSGLEQLQAQAQEHMASIARIPLVKLLGTTPLGLNASSEGELRAFYDWIAAFQELLFRDHLNTVLWFVQLSLFGEVDPEITIEFKPLWQLDEAARTAVEKTKTDIDDANVAMGAVLGAEVRERLANDKHSQYAALDLHEPLPEPDPFTEENDALGDPAEALGAPETAGKPRDLRDRSESITATAGNLESPTGGFGGDAALLPKASVAFEHPAKGSDHCGECQYFVEPVACALVAGRVEPEDWCKRFEQEGISAVDAAITPPVTLYHGTRAAALRSIRDNGLLAHPFKREHPDRFYQGERGDSVYLAPDPRVALDWALENALNPADVVVLRVSVPADRLVPDEALPATAERFVGDIPPGWIKAVIPVTLAGVLGEPETLAEDDEGAETRFVPVAHVLASET